jgi:hypothetical protein
MTKLPNGTRVRIISTIDRGKWNGMTGTVSESGKNVYDYRVIGIYVYGIVITKNGPKTAFS